MGFKTLTTLSIALVTLTILSIWLPYQTQAYMIGSNPYHRAEYLDTQGMYYFEWLVDHPTQTIYFNITAGTTGYVLFGLANNASSTAGADIIIGGVQSNGESYFSDRYTLRNNEVPREDNNRRDDDYVLLSATENRTHTTLSFSRSFDTCDRLDYPITHNKVTVIWGYGVTDEYEVVREFGVQGSSNFYLLDPEYSPRISRDRRFNGQPTIVTRDNFQTWTIRRQIVIPENSTSYICSIHRAPRLSRKHHMVGVDLYFHSQGSRRRTHHLLIYKCGVPGGGDPRPIFEQYEGGQGQTCYLPQRPPTGGPIPTHYCSELWAGWAVGGRSFFAPPHVGYPFGLSEYEYYLVQVHYDNPEKRKGVIVDMRIDMFYTSYLRPNDAGMMGIGHENPALPPSILIPPNTADQRIFSYCSPECSERIVPKEGIKIFAALLHSHYSGRRLRFRHFTQELDKELPWILWDDNYSNSLQQARILKEEVQVLPGDQLSMECTYDNTWQNSSIVGGFSTTQEMCVAFIWYYNRIPEYSYCRSEIVSEEYRRRFLGVSNITWVEDELEWVAVTPPHLAGLSMTEISNGVEWTERKREELMNFHEAHPHIGRCSRNLEYRDARQVQMVVDSGALELTENASTDVNTADDFSGPVRYPFRAKPYVPEQTCTYTG